MFFAVTAIRVGFGSVSRVAPIATVARIVTTSGETGGDGC